MVEVGLTPPEVTNTLPSTMNRFFTSCERPHSLTTERAGSVPIRAVPSRCQPPYRMGLLTQMSVASAAARTSSAWAMPCAPWQEALRFAGDRLGDRPDAAAELERIAAHKAARRVGFVELLAPQAS